MQGVNADFGVISTVFADTNPTMPYLRANYLPFPRPASQFILNFSQLSLRGHNSMETIAVTPPLPNPNLGLLGLFSHRRVLPFQIRPVNPIFCSPSVQKSSKSSHSGTASPAINANKVQSAARPH
jgi:hypothetical protein